MGLTYVYNLPKSPSFCRSFSSSMSKFLSLKAAGLTKASIHPKASTCADAPTHIPHTADHHDLSSETMRKKASIQIQPKSRAIVDGEVTAVRMFAFQKWGHFFAQAFHHWKDTWILFSFQGFGSLRGRAVAINKDPTIFHLFSPQHPVMLALMINEPSQSSYLVTRRCFQDLNFAACQVDLLAS